MISTVQTPLPIRAAIAPSDWPQRCAPSPESLMISTMCSLSVISGLAAGRASGLARARAMASRRVRAVISFILLP